jgi:ferric-dicitrate binding protein FerR (iron transport regulator)
MSGVQGNSYAFRNRSQRIGDATAAIWHQRHEEQNAMKTQRKRTVSRAVGAGLVIGGAVLSAVLLTGAQAPQVSDNAHLGQRVWVNTEDVSTVGITSFDLLPGRGNTVVSLPDPSVTVTDEDSRGNTVVGLPGPSITVTDEDSRGNTIVGLPGPSITVPGGNAPGNTIVWFPGGGVVTGSTFVF